MIVVSYLWLCACSVTSQSRTRKARRRSTAKRSRSTARQTVWESTRTRTRPSSMKMVRSLVSTVVERRVANVLTKMERHRQHCRHLYNVQPIHLPAYLPYTSSLASTVTMMMMMVMVIDRCCLSCCFVLSNEDALAYLICQLVSEPCWTVPLYFDHVVYAYCSLWQLTFQLLFGPLRLVELSQLTEWMKERCWWWFVQ